MARPKKQFTDAMNFTISQMVEINKTLLEIKSELKKLYNFDVTEPTLSTHIKSLGYDKVDNRIENKGKVKLDKLTDEQKYFIRENYLDDKPIKEIVDELINEYGLKVNESVIYKYIKEAQLKHLKMFQNNTAGFGDLSEEDKMEQFKKRFSDELFDKMKSDDNLLRFYNYNEKTLYDVDKNGNNKPWYDRNGMLMINTSRLVFVSNDKSEYETMGGCYRNENERETDRKFYDYKNLYGDLTISQIKLRKEIKGFYKKNIDLINRLYDIIIERGCREDIPQILQFNSLCEQLYNYKIKYAELLLGKDHFAVKMLRDTYSYSILEMIEGFESVCNNDNRK